MTGRDQYLIDVWKHLLEFLKTNGYADPTVIDTFYDQCYLYELTDDKASCHCAQCNLKTNPSEPG